MNFILDCDKTKCIFCTIPEEKNMEKENLVLYRGENTFVLMNKYPYSNGHLMVSTYLHKPKITDVEPRILHELVDNVQMATEALQKAFNPDGMNIGVNQGKVAGAGYDGHLHFHIVPRWNGDSNFMPVIAKTKVMAEHLEETYEKIAQFFKK